MKRIYLYAALIFAGVAAFMPAKASAQSSSLKVVSYNIRCLSGDDQGENAWEARKDGSVNMILSEEPDVIGFQEPWTPQIEYLAEKLPQYGHYAWGRENGLNFTGGEHLMIMWNQRKYELIESGHFWLSETPEVASMGWDAACYRVTLWVRLRERSTGREFYYFDTHLDHMGDVARKEGADLNVRKMKEIAGEDAALFFSGDMNVERGGRKYDLLAAYKWLDDARDTAPVTDSRATFNGWGRDKDSDVIDYIYSRNAKALTFTTLDGDGYGVRYISDHFPVAATFEF